MFHNMFIRLVVASVLVKTDAVVNLGRIPYPCCGGQPRFNLSLVLDCESMWMSKNMPFAYVKGSYNECISPCARIEGAEMILDKCVDMNLTVTCINERKLVEEKQASYYSQQCPPTTTTTTQQSTPYDRAPDHQGSMWLCLLLAWLMVFTVI